MTFAIVREQFKEARTLLEQIESYLLLVGI